MRETVDIFPCWMLIDERSSWTQLWQHLTTELGFISFRFLYSLIEFFRRPICIAKIRPTINHYTYVSKYKYQIYGAKFLSSNVCVYIKFHVWVSKKNHPSHVSYFCVGHKKQCHMASLTYLIIFSAIILCKIYLEMVDGKICIYSQRGLHLKKIHRSFFYNGSMNEHFQQ